MGYATAGVAELDRDTLLVDMGGDGQFAARLMEHSAFAVPGEIQKYLEQALTVGPYGGKARLDIQGQTDAAVFQRGFDYDAKFFEKRGQVHARGLISHLAEIHRGDFFQCGDQFAECLEILVGIGVNGRAAAQEIRISHGDGAADIANFVRDSADQNAGAGKQLMQTRLFAISQVFRNINDHGCETRSGCCLVSRKPDIGEERFSVQAASPALHGRAIGHLFVIGRTGGAQIRERRQKIADGQADQGPDWDRKQAMSGIIGKQDEPGGVGGENRGRTAFNQNTELLFGIAACRDFLFDPVQISSLCPAAVQDFVDEKAHAKESGEHEDVAGKAGLRVPFEAVEQLVQNCAKSGGGGDLPARQRAAKQQHRKEIQEAELDIAFHSPVEDRDERDHSRRADQNCITAAAE